MAYFNWATSFSVGVPELDEQHQELIAMINNLHSNLDAGVAADIVKKMFDYVAQHFRREEDLMLAVNFPELGAHIREHQAFLEKAKEFANQDFSDLSACEQLAAFLRRWYSHHIVEVDMKYKDALQQKG